MAEKTATRPGSLDREPWHIDVMIEELKQKLRNDETFLAGRVREGRMPQKAADFKLNTLREAIALFEMIERVETNLLRSVLKADQPSVQVDEIETLILDWRRDLAERARLAKPAPAPAPVTGVTGGQKSLLVYGETRGRA